jgi:hypothetical protein
MTSEEWLSRAPGWMAPKALAPPPLVAAYVMLKRIQKGGELRPTRSELDRLVKRLHKLVKE